MRNVSMKTNCVRVASPLCILVLGTSLALAQGTAFNLTLAWDPSPDSNSVAGYHIYQGTVSGFCTNLAYEGANLQCTVSNVQADITNYFIAKAYDGFRAESGPTPELSFFRTNDPGSGPSLPPLPVDDLGGGTNHDASGSGQQASQTNGFQSLIEQVAKVTGIPPAISVASDRQQTVVAVLGTVGATYEIQRTLNQQGPLLWTALGQVVITNALTNVVVTSLPSILSNTFVPGAEWFVDPEPSTEGLRYYRAVMPYDYSILADILLKPKGYGTRLVAVRMAAADAYSICFVPEESGCLRYQPDKGSLQVISSGPTIREMATHIAQSLSENWTSASEFIYTNGTKLLVATVVKTDPPSADPSPGGPSTGIVIDF